MAGRLTNSLLEREPSFGFSTVQRIAARLAQLFQSDISRARALQITDTLRSRLYDAGVFDAYRFCVAFLASPKEKNAMKTFFFRSARIARLGRTCQAAPVAETNAAASAQATPLEQQLKELDTLTRWPTHRIRSFLVTQSRSVR